MTTAPPPPPGEVANQAHTTVMTTAPHPQGATAAATATTTPSESSTEFCNAGTAASLGVASTEVCTTADTNVANIPTDSSTNQPPAQSPATSTANPDADDTGKKN